MSALYYYNFNLYNFYSSCFISTRKLGDHYARRKERYRSAC